MIRSKIEAVSIENNRIRLSLDAGWRGKFTAIITNGDSYLLNTRYAEDDPRCPQNDLEGYLRKCQDWPVVIGSKVFVENPATVFQVGRVIAVDVVNTQRLTDGVELPVYTVETYGGEYEGIE